MSFHDAHCTNCYSTSCDSDGCPIVKCNECKVFLHNCKLEEHVEYICRKATVICPNFENGCYKHLIREKIGSHLVNCIASTVVCSRDRCRKIVTKQCKLDLKCLGKTKAETVTPVNASLDIAIAIYDQNQILRSYNTSRQTRVRQRDPINPAHPLLPLRSIIFDESLPGPEDVDSSEDEREERRAKLKKSRMVFANCYMCQIDPSVQHLHTLGNGDELAKRRKKRITPQVMDKFHLAYGLKVHHNAELVPECSTKGEKIREIQKGGTMYSIKCLKTVKRSEYGDHCLSQHTFSVDQLEEFVVRCPNWSKGCQFSSYRMRPENGELRFHEHSNTISHCVNKNAFPTTTNNNFSLHNLPLWVYEQLSMYLPSSALYNLSLTSRQMREVVFKGFFDKCYVEPKWVKSITSGKWKIEQLVRKVSATEAAPKLVPHVPIELNQHIGMCPFFDPVVYETTMEKPFCVQDKPKWELFCQHLAEARFRVDHSEDFQ